MAQRKSFATETVVSHPSKLELAMRARDLGYAIVVVHSGVDQADLSVERVRQRVREGGRTVPEQKIRDRYDRNGPLMRAAVLASTRGLVFANSMVNQPPERIIAFANGRVVFVRPHVPAWARAVYGEDLR